MSTLVPCRSCHRHCRTSEASCPFCGARRVAVGATVIAIATLAMACDGPAAQTPNNNVVIPQPTTSASASSPTATSGDAGAAPMPTSSASDINRPAPMYGLPPVTVTPPPDVHRAAPMYGLPPPSSNH